MIDLTKEDIKNILIMMARADLKGSEALAYIQCEQKLKTMLNEMVNPKPKAKPKPKTPVKK